MCTSVDSRKATDTVEPAEDGEQGDNFAVLGLFVVPTKEIGHGPQ